MVMKKNIKEWLRTLLYRFLSILVRKGYDQPLLGCVVKAIDDNSKNFLRYKLYPKEFESFGSTFSLSAMKKGEFAILLQGPIEHKDNYTKNSILLYKNLYPNAIIIISTWDNTEKKVLDEFVDLGCEVVVNKQFDGGGFGNVNFQVFTSLNGVRRAKELGAKYTLKSRTDQRIYKNYALEYLKSLLLRYPVINTYGIPLRSRIIGVEGGIGTRYYPYWMQDYLYFGETEDLENYLTIDKDTRTPEECIKLTNKNGVIYVKDGKEYCSTNPPEIYIMKSFLSKYIQLDGTLKQYWDFVKDYFIIIGFDDLDLLWKKYPSTDSISSWTTFYNGRTLYKEEERSHSFQFFCSLCEGMVNYNEEVEKIRERIKLSYWK